MTIVKLSATHNATKRTKERIQEHGPCFEQMDTDNNPPCFPGTPCALMSSSDFGWMGWLPLCEIDVAVISQSN